MGGAAGPDFGQGKAGRGRMTQTLEGRPAARRTLERRVVALHWGSAMNATSASVTAAGHRGEGGTP